MSRRARFLVLLPFLLLVLAIVGGLWTLARASRPHARRLPDGSMLALHQLTYGQEHTWLRGQWWQKLLYPLLPAQKQRRLFPQVFRSASPNALVFGTFRSGVTPEMSWDRQIWRTRVVAFDEHGCETETGRRGHGVGFGWPSSEALEAWELPAFPRRGKLVGVRIYEQGPNGPETLFAEYTTSNPTPGPHPVWTPEPLPITRREGPLAFTLTGLSTGIQRSEAGRSRATPRELWTRATLQVTRDGKPAPEWKPIGVTIADATRNTWTPPSRVLPGTRGGDSLEFLGALWSDEAAWKLRVKFARTAVFAPEELWTVRGVRIPEARAITPLNRSALRQGVTLRLVDIGGVRARRHLRPWPLPETPSMHVKVSPPSEAVRLTLHRATDGRGRAIPVEEAEYLGRGDYLIRVRTLADVKTLDLTFAAQKPRVVEFLAAPKQVSPGS